MKKQNRNKRDGFVVAVVASDSSRRKYKIRKTTDGLVCPCLSFRYAHGAIGSRTKVCKHIERMGM